MVKMNNSFKSLMMMGMICLTVIIVAVVGGLIYMQRQDFAQKDRQLQQQYEQKENELKQAKELKEYEQEQINNRAQKDRICKGDNPYSKFGAGC